MRRKVLVAAMAVLTILLAAACGKNKDERAQPENSALEETAQERETGGTQDTQQETAQEKGPDTKDQVSENDVLVGGSAQELVYEVEYEELAYEAEDGTAIFTAKLAYPKIIKDTAGALAMNRFFENWRDEKIREYDTQEDSTWRQALEVYRESRDFGWMGPWSEEYQVTSVSAQNGYVSVLLDSYLYEGENHGTPYRESFLFRKSDGQRVSLMQESGLGKAEWGRMLEEKFKHLVSEAEEEEYYSDAAAIIEDMSWEQVGAYFGNKGIVFYLPPYEIGPYSSGYAEVTASFEEIFGTY